MRLFPTFVGWYDSAVEAWLELLFQIRRAYFIFPRAWHAMRRLETHQKVAIAAAALILYVSVQPWLLAHQEKRQYMLLEHPSHFNGMIGGTIVAALIVVWAFAPRKGE